MELRIYAETPVISYLTARPSRDPVQAARQLQSRALWDAVDRWDTSCRSSQRRMRCLEERMNERNRSDSVLNELWAVKDSTAQQHRTVADYLDGLRATSTGPRTKVAAGPGQMKRSGK